MENKININVNMDGEDYIKYKEKQKFKLSKNVKKSLPYFIAALFGIIFIMTFINIITPKPPLSWNHIFMIMAICAGLGWIFHGTGFLIVKG